jgi:glycosyltransferase involved in cell wall biosynthesis
MSKGAVLVVGRAIHPPWNEGARVIARSVAELAAERRPVRIVSLTQPSFLELAASSGLEGARHVPARADGVVGDYRALPAVLSAVRATLREQPVAVAHVIGLPLAVAPVLRRAGVRVIAHATLGGHVYQGRVDRLRDRAARLFDPWVDAYACASETVRESLLASGHAARTLHVLGPPVDETVFAPVDRGEARRALDVPQDAFLVAYIGTVSPLRFPGELVAAALVRARSQIASLRLEAFAPVGTHGYNVEWARDNVGLAAERAGAPMRVRLEDLADDRKALVYAAADVVLLPFAAPVAVEPPLTLLEALACGATVLVAPNANRSGLVEHGRTGMTYDGGEALAERLVELDALGPAGRAALGAAGRELVVGTFGHAAALAALERLWTAVGVT